MKKSRGFVGIAIATSSLCCASPDMPPGFQLTLIGIQVEDTERTLQFYEDDLGVHIFQRREGGAMVSPGWTLPAVSDGRGLTVELFETTTAAPANRSFGTDQSVRPSIQVRGLNEAVDALRERGVAVTEDVRRGEIGEQVVVRTPEGIDWAIASAEGLPAGDSLADPHFGWLDIKVADLEAQLRFYSELFGLTPGHYGSARTLTITREITLIPTIGLQYFVVEDPDGNPVQVFESAAPEWLRWIAYRYFFPLFWEEAD